MPKIEEATKQQRLDRIYLLLSRHTLGLTEAEIADEISLERRTTNNYLRELETQGKAYKDGLYWIPFKLKESRLQPLDLSPEEAVTLYLGARLLAKQQDKRNEPAETALVKLATVLKADAGMGDEIAQAARELANRPMQEGYQPIFRDMVRGYIYRKKVEISYRPLRSNKTFQTTFSTYLIEPSPLGFATYLIGYSSNINALRAYKLERIEAAHLTRESYAVPPDFPGLEILRNAWNIMLGEETLRVTLRFHPDVKKRVLETRWHPSQQTAEDPKAPGSLRWQVDVADTLDLIPWIRGWGADVEVIEPESLRKALMREAGRLARLYQVGKMENIPQYFHLWAKTDRVRGTEQIHPLIYHLLDVGECALALWNQALSEHTRQMLSQALNLDIETTGRTLAFWTALHDLGKAAPGFQRKYAKSIPGLEKQGFTFPKNPPIHATQHATISTWALKEHLLAQETGMIARDAKLIAFALGGHHGAWPTMDKIDIPKADKGDGIWDTVRLELLRVLKETYQPASPVHLPEDQGEVNAFLTLFSGLVSVADWLGSMVENFPFFEDYLPAQTYVKEYARPQANDALVRLGWLGWQADGNRLSFAAMFPDLQANKIQQKTIASAENCALPALVILEAPTGIGKTEAALFLADTWLQTQKGKGIYIAMPTQATSNQMFGRTTRFLVQRYPNQPINTHLVHGAALLKDEEEIPQPQGIAEDEQNNEGNVKAEAWFLPRKRTLLAPFGVGTVDQALMSVLQTNHFFVRMFGLGQKVVIFDEIHAYDTYMSTLFQRLLRWLRAIGTSVILLSATLPENTRQALVGAWLGDEEIVLPPAEYPRLTVVGGDTLDVVALPAPETHTLHLTQTDPEPEKIAAHLAEKLQAGGCAAVICNRVQRAQDVYEAIKASGIVEPKYLILFHARFPFAWRAEIEERVLSQFGKDKDHPNQPNPKRPHKAIVVATQVIEQSLDLDFDYMLTDLAPIDLLLQRAGRLHRHTQNNANRPLALKNPVLAITRSPEKDGLPTFGADVWVYEPATLLRSWYILNGRDSLNLPDETSGLIESVYGAEKDKGPFDPIWQQALKGADEKSKRKFDDAKDEAFSRLIRFPDDEYLLTRTSLQLEEDDETVGATFRALTRLAEPGVSLICLHETAQGLALDVEGTGAPINIKERPNQSLAKKLLMCAVNVQRRDVVEYFIKKVKTSAAWQKSAAVRYHYPINFDQNGRYEPKDAGFILQLTPELGLEVFNKEDQ